MLVCVVFPSLRSFSSVSCMRWQHTKRRDPDGIDTRTRGGHAVETHARTHVVMTNKLNKKKRKKVLTARLLQAASPVVTVSPVPRIASTHLQSNRRLTAARSQVIFCYPPEESFGQLIKQIRVRFVLILQSLAFARESRFTSVRTVSGRTRP